MSLHWLKLAHCITIPIQRADTKKVIYIYIICMGVTKFPRQKHVARIFSSQETLPTGSSSSNLQASFAAQDVELGTEAFRATC